MKRAWIVLAGIGSVVAIAALSKKKGTPSPATAVVDSGTALARGEGQRVSWSIMRKGDQYAWKWSGLSDQSSGSSSPFEFTTAQAAKADLVAHTGLVPLPRVPQPARIPAGSTVYPPDADSVPDLDDPEGVAFSDDCSVAVSGPEWEEKIRDFASAMVELSTDEVFQSALEDEFPQGCDLSAVGAKMLRDRLWETVSETREK